MSKIKKTVRWIDFVLSLQESMTSLEGAMSKSRNDIESVRKEIMLLVARLEHFDQLLSRIERRLDRLEDRHSNVVAVSAAAAPSDVPRLQHRR